MIKIQDIKYTPKQAALRTAMNVMMNFGTFSDEDDLLENMTQRELIEFMEHYSSEFNRIAQRAGEDPVEPEDMLVSGWRSRYIRMVEENGGGL